MQPSYYLSFRLALLEYMSKSDKVRMYGIRERPGSIEIISDDRLITRIKKSDLVYREDDPEQLSPWEMAEQVVEHIGEQLVKSPTTIH